MGRKCEPIQIFLYTQDGTPIKKLTPEMIRRQEENLSRDLSAFVAKHPEMMDSLRGKDYVTFIPMPKAAAKPGGALR